MRKKLPKCIRCGLCCIAAPCSPNERGVCEYLSINDDLTTTCMSKTAVENLVGIGCVIRGPRSSYAYEKQCETFSLVSTKQALLMERVPGGQNVP